MAAGLLICLLAACNNEPLDPTGGPNDNYLEISFSRTTRADLDESGAGNFSEGDCVGLYIDNGSETRYRELTYTSGEWQPRLRRSEFGEGELILAAHYPVLPETAADPTHAAFTLADNQSAEGFAASDLLFARQNVPAGSYRASMTFSHALHRLRVEIQGEDVSTPSLRSRMSGTVDLLTGTVSVAEDSFGWITPRTNSDGTYEAVIFPQAVDTYRDEEGLLKIPTAVREVVYKAPDQLNGQSLTEFEAGKQLTIRLNLTSTGDPEWANRKVWVYGIKAPEESAWKQYFIDRLYDYYALAWKPEYGWYDCNKVNAVVGGVDCYMCWAAAASNLLHWWIEQNKSYIERYGKYQGPDYNYPLKKMPESDIFKSFCDSFKNEAGYTDEGINWFIQGKKPVSQPYIEPYNPAGYFKDVFPVNSTSTDLLSYSVGGLSKERFNNTIKDALANKKAIAVCKGLVRDGHFETIWGAEFDENGDVSAIYMADNNDRDYDEEFGVGCIRFKIRYEKYPEGATYTAYDTGYMEGSKPIAITRLILLPLAQDRWEEYFARQASQADAE